MKFVIFLNLIMADSIVRRGAKLDEASKAADEKGTNRFFSLGIGRVGRV